MSSSEILSYLLIRSIDDHASGALLDAPVVDDSPPGPPAGWKAMNAIRAASATFLRTSAWRIEPHPMDRDCETQPGRAGSNRRRTLNETVISTRWTDSYGDAGRYAYTEAVSHYLIFHDPLGDNSGQDQIPNPTQSGGRRNDLAPGGHRSAKHKKENTDRARAKAQVSLDLLMLARRMPNR